MFCKKYTRIIGIFCLLLFAFTARSQYLVSGGAGTPLLAKDDTRNRIQVYLVNGIDNVTLSYSSTSSSHQWYRYKENAINPEKISGEQDGTTSVIKNIESDFGYFVDEGGAMSRYIWIIDYSKYQFDIESLQILDDNPCEEVILKSTPEVAKIFYNAPNGDRIELEREFQVIYNTLIYTDKIFSPITVDTIISNPFKTALPPPLCDTEFTIKGDLFAKHFNLDKTVKTPFYQAVAVKAYVEQTKLSEDGDNMINNAADFLSAPTIIRFKAIANTPVASYFRWTIMSGKENNPWIRNEEEFDFSFDKQDVTYTVKLEVSDRTGVCVDSTYITTLKTSQDDIDIPNVFSPGTSPGINDEFRIAYKSLVGFKGWIFNRWGVELFHWTDPSKGWDGKKNGKYVPMGTYFYVIEYKSSEGRTIKRSGNINVIIPRNAQ